MAWTKPHWINNRTCFGGEKPWRSLRYCRGICLEWLRKSMNTRIWWPVCGPRYELGPIENEVRKLSILTLILNPIIYCTSTQYTLNACTVLWQSMFLYLASAKPYLRHSTFLYLRHSTFLHLRHSTFLYLTVAPYVPVPYCGTAHSYTLLWNSTFVYLTVAHFIPVA